MAKAEPSWSPWGRKRKQDAELLKTFGRQCRLHMEAEVQHMIAVEREKVLCDLAVHAEFINQWLEAATTQLRQGLQYDAHEPQSDCFLLPQDQQLPDSYMARILRSTTRQQVQQVLRMTPREWADEMTSWFADFSVQFELLTCPGQDLSAPGASNTQAVDCPVANPAQGTTQQQDAGSFSSAGTACDAPTAVALGAPFAAQGSLLQSQDGGSFSSSGTASFDAGFPAAYEAPAAAAAHSSPCRAAVGTPPSPAVCAHPTAAHPTAAHSAPVAAAPEGLGALPLQRSGSSGAWVLRRCPINVAPARASEALKAVVDRGVRLCSISTVLGAMVHLAGEAILTGGRVDPFLENGEAITDQLQLTELQQLHLYICMEELARMNRTVQEQRSHLLQLAAQPTLQLAAAAAHNAGPQNIPKQQPRQQKQTRTPLDCLELAECLESGLLRVSDRLHSNMVSVFMFLVNTLSHHQLAVLSVACYPRIASTFTVANVVHKRVRQQQQALLAAVDRTARQTRTNPAPLTEHPQAGLFALSGRAHVGASSSGRGSYTAAHSSASVAGNMLQEHEQQRMAQLLHHQKVCWEQLGCQPMQQ